MTSAESNIVIFPIKLKFGIGISSVVFSVCNLPFLGFKYKKMV